MIFEFPGELFKLFIILYRLPFYIFFPQSCCENIIKLTGPNMELCEF